MSSWAVGVAYARMLHIHERHADLLKIATLSDFCGTRWQVNSVMIPTPSGRSYLLPVAHVMRLYKRHGGEQATSVLACPEGLDVTSSRSGPKLFLHVVNTRREQSITARLEVQNFSIASGRCFEIAADPQLEVLESCSDVLGVTETKLSGGEWTFPAASVSAIELDLLAL